MLPEENVQSFPRPPRLERVQQEIVATLGGREILRTSAAMRVLETHHPPTYYIPRDHISAILTEAPGSSLCEWKGQARYWTLSVPGTVAPRSAWDYPSPTPAFYALRNHLAIYAHALDRCSVGGVDVAPQPGGFYGGWVTPNLTGIVKGGPGTEGW